MPVFLIKMLFCVFVTAFKKAIILSTPKAKAEIAITVPIFSLS
jgi:hypothetical protein